MNKKIILYFIFLFPALILGQDLENFNSTSIPELEKLISIAIKQNNYQEYEKKISTILPKLKEKNTNLSNDFYEKGKNKLEEKKYYKAIAEFEKALQFDNNNPDIYFSLAKCYNIMNKNNKALLIYLKLIGITTDKEKAFIGLADTYRYINDFKNSDFFYSFVLSISPDNKEAKHGLEELKKQIEFYENSAENHFYNGKKLLENSDIEKSINAFLKSLELNENFLPSYIELGGIYINQDKLDKAMEMFDKSLKFDEEYIPAYLGISKVFYKEREYEKAKTILEKAKKIDEEDEAIALQLDIVKQKIDIIAKQIKAGDILYENGCLKEALEKYYFVLENTLDNNIINIKIGDIYLELNNLEKANEHYNAVLIKDKTSVPALIGRAKIFEKENNPEMASKYFRQVLILDSENPYAKNFLKYDSIDNKLSSYFAAISNTEQITRGELAALIAKHIELTKKKFDISEGVIIMDIDDYWAKPYIKKIVELKILDLFPNRMFLPYRKISRGEFAEYLKNIYLQLSDEKIKDKNFSQTMDSSPYADVLPLHGNFNAIILNSIEGIISGYPDNIFKADDPVSGKDAKESIEKLNNLLKSNYSQRGI